MSTTGASLSQFRASSRVAIADIKLQSALEGATGRFLDARGSVLAQLPGAEAMRDTFKQIRAATLAQLGEHLVRFEAEAIEAGAHVHWARDAAEAQALVVDIAREHGVELAVKVKSMASEEIQLNEALAQAGVRSVETDLGEWLIQQAGQPPSHIIAPAIHLTRQQAAEYLSAAADRPLDPNDIPALAAAARHELRQRFLAAGMGISGGNVLVAESGSLVLVTNEGNGRLCTSAPPVHVAVVGIEKVVPTWREAAIWLSLLARSATGQPMSIYTSVITGPARPDDIDGPKTVHIILLDNSRSRLLGGEFEEILQCIRCGACLNTCPVYREAGGHAYGSPYSGPVGAVVSPLLFGLEAFEALPQASTLCGACRDVCPARIDIPRMLLALRAELVDGDLVPRWEQAAERAVGHVFGGERRYRAAATLGRVLQRPFRKGSQLRLPGSLQPTAGRDLPALAPRSFRAMWAAGNLDETEDA